MSLHFLIDGYNIIKQTVFLKDMPDLKSSRRELVKIIQDRSLLGSKNNRCTIVFDGNEKYKDLFSSNNERIKIIFSINESADEKIKKIVQQIANPKQVVVVSDDKEIIFFTRSLGANVMSVISFWEKPRKGKQIIQKTLLQEVNNRGETLKRELTYFQQDKINKELRQLWS